MYCTPPWLKLLHRIECDEILASNTKSVSHLWNCLGKWKLLKSLGGTNQAPICLERKANNHARAQCRKPHLSGLQLILTVNLPIALNQDRCGAFKIPKDDGLHLPGPTALLGMKFSLMSDLLPSSCSLYSWSSYYIVSAKKSLAL